ncbi:MAG: sulfatase activating formylglycine-generating enzyme [Crocinitomicaceae bacterium]|jgi:formylglycine-generating enzyme required for sulfatase activity
MKWLQLLVILLPFCVLSQSDTIFIQFTEDDDEFTACENYYAANGLYSITPRDIPKLKIPGTILVSPLEETNGNQLIFSSKSTWSREYGWFETPVPYLEHLTRDEVDTIMNKTDMSGRYPRNYMAYELSEKGIFLDQIGKHIRDSLTRMANLRYAEEKRIRDSTYHAINGQWPWNGDGIIDGVYISDQGPRGYYRQSDYFEVFTEVKDSVNQAHMKIRKELIEPQLDSMLQPFYMSIGEVSNREYREFVNWVKDSIAREEIYFGLEDDEEASKYLTYTELYLIGPDYIDDYGDLVEEYEEFDPSERELNRLRFPLNWEKKFHYHDPKLVPILATMYYPQQQRYYKRKELDSRRLNYQMNDQEINVYPDTLGFVKMDGIYLNPYLNMYFWHPAYDNYPVVNVNFQQIEAFIHWKEKQINQNGKKGQAYITVSIPSIMQYEFALKTALSNDFAARTKNAPNSHFVTYERESTWDKYTFLTRIYQEARKIGKHDKPETRVHKKLFNSWLRDNGTAPFYFLNGNVSELVNDSVNKDALEYYGISSLKPPAELNYVLGGNYAMGVKTKSDESFNALFYKSVISKKKSSPRIGFRLVYTLSITHEL